MDWEKRRRKKDKGSLFAVKHDGVSNSLQSTLDYWKNKLILLSDNPGMER